MITLFLPLFLFCSVYFYVFLVLSIESILFPLLFPTFFPGRITSIHLNILDALKLNPGHARGLLRNCLTLRLLAPEQDILAILHLIIKKYRHSIVLNLSTRVSTRRASCPGVGCSSRFWIFAFRRRCSLLMRKSGSAESGGRQSGDSGKIVPSVQYPFWFSCFASPMEGELMSTTQVRQPLAAFQPAARRIRRVYSL